MIYRLTWWLCRLVGWLMFRCESRGVENVPRTGPVIVACNHASHLDPPLASTTYWRPTAFMAKEELFQSRLFAWYIRRLNAFPVKRGTADRGAIKQMEEFLKNGWAVMMFPEGTRSPDGNLRQPELGVAMIAYRTGAPVVPVYIEGTDRAMPPGGKLRPGKVKITYGKPLLFRPADGNKASREEYVMASRQIMEAIAALKPSTPR